MARNLDRYLIVGLATLTGVLSLAQAWGLVAISAMLLLAVLAHRARM